MTDRELMQQALEALENAKANFGDWWPEVIIALRERLAQPEPWKVEEVYKDGVLVERRMKRGPDCEWEPWHTPRRDWVGLTEEEVDECYYWKGRQWTTDELVRHVEAKLKEKNA